MGSRAASPRRPASPSVPRRLRHLLALAVALTAAALAVAVPEASAYRVSGSPWPGGLVRYHNAAGDQAWAVKEAVSAWNRSGARVRFVPVPRARAQLLIQHVPERGCPGYARATVGYRRGAIARVWIPRLDRASPGCNGYGIARAVAHELGHVLGLGHEDRGCAAMNPEGSFQGSRLCDRLDLWNWRCRLLEHDDVRGAISLYGGGPVRVRAEPGCPLYSPIVEPTAFAAVYDPEQPGIALVFTRPALPGTPVFLASYVNGGGYAFARKQDACPGEAELGAARRLSWQAEIGEETRIYDRPGPAGRYCYALWALDGLGRPSARPALSWVDLPAQQ
jgi:hypothetical protein